MAGISPIFGVILIDHGSRIPEANDLLNEVVHQFKESSGIKIVEPAHMELAEPTLAQAFETCVNQGAGEIIIHPYFLAPGRHSTQDIPHMASMAAALFPRIPFRITPPLGLDPRMSEIILQRIHDSLGITE